MTQISTTTVNTVNKAQEDSKSKNLNNTSTVAKQLDEAYLKQNRQDMEHLLNAEANLSDVPDIEKEVIEHNKDLDDAVEESLSEPKTNKFENILDNFMKFVTTAAVSFNGLSAATDFLNSGVLKQNIPETSALKKPLDFLSMAANRGQALGFGSDVLREAFERKDATLLIAGFGKIFQVVMANSEDFLQLGGIQTAFDQLKPACEKLIGKSKFSGFGESLGEYIKAIKTIFKDMKDDPMGYLTLNPKNGKVEQVLLPGSIMMLAGTFGCLASGENKVLKTISSVFRHVIGGVLGGDVILAKISDNKDLSSSGWLYGAASILDTVATPLKEKASAMGHKLANMLYFGAEFLFLKGLKQDAASEEEPL